MKFLSFFFLILLFSCNDEEANMIVSTPDWTKDESINMNAQFSQEESEEIDEFLKRHPDWKMTETGTGLRYMIYHKSESTDSAKVGNTVFVDFEVSLLSSEICYTSSKGPESFIVEKTDIESGLHEGLKYMCVGDKAKFIIPSHAAHGLVGDTDKIPPLSPVIYDIELLKIEL